MISILQYITEEEYRVPMKEKTKVPGINPRTGRKKNKKITKYLFTNIKPEDRELKNMPRYANKKSKVRFQDWLAMEAKKRSPSHTADSIGLAANGKYYGWSHRAIHGFAIGEKITNKASGFERLKKPYTIKTVQQQEEAARKFASSVS